jgi:hypothetical protein
MSSSTNVNPTGRDSTASSHGSKLGPVVRDAGMLDSKACGRPWTPASALEEAQSRRNRDTSIRKSGR